MKARLNFYHFGSLKDWISQADVASVMAKGKRLLSVGMCDILGSCKRTNASRIDQELL